MSKSLSLFSIVEVLAFFKSPEQSFKVSQMTHFQEIFMKTNFGDMVPTVSCFIFIFFLFLEQKTVLIFIPFTPLIFGVWYLICCDH